jgi:hypothetical protein
MFVVVESASNALFPSVVHENVFPGTMAVTPAAVSMAASLLVPSELASDMASPCAASTRSNVC